MHNEFIISVSHKGVQRHMHAKLLQQGHSHKIVITTNETEIYFEPDEEGSYRAVKMPWQEERALMAIDKQLLQAIQVELQKLNS